MPMIKKGYLFMSILAVLVLCITSFIGNNGFLSEKKGNNECLNLKEKYSFLDCDSLSDVGEEELLEIISNFKETKNEVFASNIQDEKAFSDAKENKEEKSNYIENENIVLLSLKSIKDLSLDMKNPQELNAKIRKNVDLDEMNSKDFLIKMANTNANSKINLKNTQ